MFKSSKMKYKHNRHNICIIISRLIMTEHITGIMDMDNSTVSTITLCAGKGSRMGDSTIPKCAIEMLGAPMIIHVQNAILKFGSTENYAVVGYKKEILEEILSNYNITCVEQSRQLGTGHAVSQVIPFLEKSTSTDVIVLMGDMPTVTHELLNTLMSYHREHNAVSTMVTIHQQDPAQNARIIRNDSGGLHMIIEFKDIEFILDTHDERDYVRSISEINTGLYVFNRESLLKYLPLISNNNSQNEYYLPDVIKIQLAHGLNAQAFLADGMIITPVGANTKQELDEMEKAYVRRFA